jgi:hypothetical protein
MKPYRSILVIVLGVGLLLAGLAWDIALHSSGEALSSEDLFAVDNPGHLVLGIGLALIIAGTALALFDAQPRLRAFSLPSLAAVALITFASAVLSYGLTVGGEGHSHDTLDANLPTEEEIRQQLRDSGLSEEDIALVETSRHDHIENVDLALSAAEVVALGKEIETSMAVAARYQSIETAIAEGYVQITQDLPLIGAHYLNLDYSSDGIFDLERPEMLIYHFENGAWRLYGLSYLSAVLGVEGEVPPTGFTGPYDVWHWHEGWCFTLKGARKSDGSDCKQPIEFYAARTGYMVHVWSVENPSGVFSHSHPGLTGSPAYQAPKDVLIGLIGMRGQRSQ